MKNIHLIPTDKPSRLGYLTKKGKEVLKDLRLFDRLMPNILDSENQNIYITSDEEIKDVRPHKGKWQLEKGQILNKFPDYLTDLSECKLVIMTTDQDLIKDGVQPIADEFLEWFVKNPSCEFVEIELKTKQLVKPYDVYNEQVSYYKIIVPQEEPKQESFVERIKPLQEQWQQDMYKELMKQETLEEAAEKWVFETNGHKWSNNNNEAADNFGSFKAGAQWQQEKMYSKKEVVNKKK